MLNLTNNKIIMLKKNSSLYIFYVKYYIIVKFNIFIII